MSSNKRISDENLAPVNDDPRVRGENGQKIQKVKGAGRNTESFDPQSTLCRPDMRIQIGKKEPVYSGKLKHDDVLVIPEFFCDESDWSIYYRLVEEMRQAQADGRQGEKSSWISWHEGAHLITKAPESSPLFLEIQDKISKFLQIPQTSVGTRFNWYRDSSDWKPFHHDSAAYNPHRARNQNITVGVSFGSTRELAFLHANSKTKIYFPQTNGMLFTFGRDVNITWKHGINALPEEDHDGKGRISIVLWGLCPTVINEKGSPPMLDDNTRGNGYSMHAPNTGSGPGSHQNRSGPADLGDREVCRDFLRQRCTHGDRCRFFHPPANDERDNSHRRGRDERDRRHSDNIRGHSRSRDRGSGDLRDRVVDRNNLNRPRDHSRDYLREREHNDNVSRRDNNHYNDNRSREERSSGHGHDLREERFRHKSDREESHHSRRENRGTERPAQADRSTDLRDESLPHLRDDIHQDLREVIDNSRDKVVGMAKALGTSRS